MRGEMISRAWIFQHKAMKDSELVPGEKVFDKKSSYVICPRCGHMLPWLEHGEPHVCGSCHLKVTLWGAAFEIC